MPPLPNPHLRKPITQRDRKLLRKMEAQLTTRRGAAGFEKAQLLGRDIRLNGKVKLAQVPPLPPLAQQAADWLWLKGIR